MRPLPSGTVTFLFTDIQGSTELWDTFPDEMRRALASHDEIIGGAVEAAEGAVIKSTGDGIFAAFASAGSAVAAAVDAQQRLAVHEWDALIGSIEVRMAMHTDQAEAKDGDYHGGAINRTARIEAAGHGGQILLSDAAAHAVEQLPPATEIIELGTHHLRGLSRPETIHQLVVAGLRSSFPPLRTASVAAGVLPEFATSFVGRASDIEAIGEQLGSPDCRVLTVLGPGGIGKTRLSVEAARLVGDTAGAVAHFVPLASVQTPDGIIGEIADSLNFTVDLHLSSVVDETTQVLDLLKKQRMVLVLDNFEHLVSGAALVTRIVETAPDVDIVVTSRERLGIGSEWIYELGGLTMEGESPAAVTSDAVELFLERARQAGGMIPAEDGERVAALCRALGGMPLAIELAAAWTPVISVEEIASEVQTSLDILAGSRADVPERHRSVRAAFEQSWNRLAPDLQGSFSKLAIFPAPFTREAATEVAATSLPTLMALINKSLVHRAELDTYNVHPLLRELGLESLGDQRPAAARKHAEYYIGRLLGRADQLAGSAEQIAVKDELTSELGNLRPATLWALDNRPPERVVEILRTLQEFYFLASWAQAIDHFEALAVAVETAVGAEASVQDDRYLWAKTFALCNLSQFGNMDQVATGVERLLPGWEDRGGVGLAWALTAQGIAGDMAGELEQARGSFERALGAGFEGDTLLQIIHNSWYGWVIIEQGDAEQARAIWQESLTVAEAANHQSGRAYLLSKLGVAADELGEHQEAANLHHESREIFVKAGDLGGEGYTLSRLSWTYSLLGDYAKAKQYGEEGLAKFDEINHRWGVATCWSRIGMAELGLENTEAAATAFHAGMELAVSNKMQTSAYYALLGMGKVFAAEGRLEEAVQLLSYSVQAPQNPYADLAEEAFAPLRDQASPEVMAAAGAMTMDEAIALAGGDRRPK